MQVKMGTFWSCGGSKCPPEPLPLVTGLRMNTESASLGVDADTAAHTTNHFSLFFLSTNHLSAVVDRLASSVAAAVSLCH